MVPVDRAELVESAVPVAPAAQEELAGLVGLAAAKRPIVQQPDQAGALVRLTGLPVGRLTVPREGRT